ncbi:MAG: SLC13 family permease [Haloferacaceae archaeon]
MTPATVAFLARPLVAGVPALTTDVLVVFAVVAAAFVLFVTEALSVDVTAIGIMVALVALGRWTGITATEAIAGFANPATITVLAMLILSDGLGRTGVVQSVGRRMADFAGADQFRQLLATVTVAGPVSGFINNTPVVAILVPVVSDLADDGGVSPSKLLIPLSYASMLGGMLTLIGTSTNILASSVSERLLGHPFGMFEFTGLGLVVLVVGAAYLLFVCPRLLPERVPADEGYLEEYRVDDYLTEVVIDPDSPIAGRTVADAFPDAIDADVLQLVRAGERFAESLGRKELRTGDRLRIRTDRETLADLVDLDGLSVVGTPEEGDLETAGDEQTLVEVVIPSGSFLVGESLESTTFRERYDATVLAFRSRGELIRTRIEDVRIQIGDTLLVQGSPGSVERLAANRDFIVVHEVSNPDYRTERAPVALAIIAGVVALPALGLTDIVVSALGGVVAMVLTGVLHPGELYDSVDWNVIFLLAGVIPLGVALDRTGGAALVGGAVAGSTAFLPPIGVLWVFYLVTALVTTMISNTASVVLMLPIAVSAARDVGANPFAFVIAVTFAASTAFLSPIGYQTNLFVYGPGGYRFTDYVRAGTPLLLVLSVVTVAGIAVTWGV